MVLISGAANTRCVLSLVGAESGTPTRSAHSASTGERSTMPGPRRNSGTGVDFRDPSSATASGWEAGREGLSPASRAAAIQGRRAARQRKATLSSTRSSSIKIPGANVSCTRQDRLRHSLVSDRSTDGRIDASSLQQSVREPRGSGERLAEQTCSAGRALG